jgi:hypothetical protein
VLSYCVVSHFIRCRYRLKCLIGQTAAIDVRVIRYTGDGVL